MKKLKFPLKVSKIFMKNQMQDNTNLILDVFNMVTRCLVVFLLYAYVFNLKGGIVNGTDYKTTMWSMFIYFCIMTLNLRKVYDEIMKEVKSGNVEMSLNKPYSYLTISFFKIIGKGLFSFLFISLVGLIMMIIFIGYPNVNYFHFIPMFITTFFLGQILALLVYGLIGVLAFFIQDVKPIYWIVDKFVMVLGGSYLPVSMFPPFMKLLAFISPFGAINFATSTVYSSFESEYLIRTLLQVTWIFIFGIILYYVYKKSLEKSMVNGG